MVKLTKKKKIKKSRITGVQNVFCVYYVRIFFFFFLAWIIYSRTILFCLFYHEIFHKSIFTCLHLYTVMKTGVFWTDVMQIDFVNTLTDGCSLQKYFECPPGYSVVCTFLRFSHTTLFQLVLHTYRNNKIECKYLYYNRCCIYFVIIY